MKPSQMLKRDHEEVKQLFKQFEDANAREQQRIVEEATKLLTVHAQLEEQLVYPQLREIVKEQDIIAEALEEHHVAKMLIQELQGLEPSDERYAAKFTVLMESVQHHIREEEKEMLPQLDKADQGLQDQMAQTLEEQKQQLLADGGAVRMGSGSERQGRTSSRGEDDGGRQPREAVAASSERAAEGRQASGSRSSGRKADGGKAAAGKDDGRTENRRDEGGESKRSANSKDDDSSTGRSGSAEGSPR